MKPQAHPFSSRSRTLAGRGLAWAALATVALAQEPPAPEVPPVVEEVTEKVTEQIEEVVESGVQEVEQAAQDAIEAAKQKLGGETGTQEAATQEAAPAGQTGHDHDGDGVEDHAAADHGQPAAGTTGTQETKPAPKTVLTTGTRPKTLDVGEGLKGIRIAPRTAPSPAQGPIVTPAGGAVGPAAPAGPAGSVVVPDGGDAIDFGELMDGEIRDHVFTFEAGGEHDLVVQSINKSCGCTQANLFVKTAEGERELYVLNTPVPPGTEFELEAEVNTSGKRDRFESTVNLSTNEATPYRAFRLQALVKPFFQYEPNQYLNLEDMFTSETKTKSMVLRSGQGEPFLLSVEPVTALPEYLAVDLTPVEPDASGRSIAWNLSATLGPNASEAASNNWPVRIVSDVPMPAGQVDANGAPTFHSTQIYVMAQVKGLVMAVPQYLSFGIVPPGETVERTAKIEIYDEQFTPGEMRVELSGMDEKMTALLNDKATAVMSKNEAGEHILTVTLSDLPEDMSEYGSPVVQGQVDVFVNHPQKESVRLVLSGVVRSRVTQPAPAPGVHGGAQR